MIGGIYTHDDQRVEGGVPWFKDIPGLGYLFKKEGKTKNRTELLIFITPGSFLPGTSRWRSGFSSGKTSEETHN